MSSSKELYDKLLKEAKQYFADKKYQEACESALQLFDIGHVKIKNEDRLFAGRVLLKAGEIEEAFRRLKYFPINYEATHGEKLLLEVIKDAKFVKGAHQLTAQIFRNALKEFDDGSLICDVAISKLDLLPDTVPVICFLTAKSNFLRGRPKDAYDILAKELDQSKTFPLIGLEGKFTELMEACAERIEKNKEELVNEDNIVRKHPREQKNLKGVKMKNLTCEEGIDEMEVMKQEIMEQGPFPNVLSLRSVVFDMDIKCYVEELKGGVPFGYFYQTNVEEASPVSFIDFGDRHAAKEAFSVMKCLDHRNIMKGICTFHESYIVVDEAISLKYWVSMKKKMFYEKSSSDFTKKQWWEFICGDLSVILRDAGRALTVLLDKKLGCSRLSKLDDDGIFVSSKNEVKIIPSKAIDKLTLIQNLKNIMLLIVGYPFNLGAEDVMNDSDFDLSHEFVFFDTIITEENLAFAGYATLLDPPFVWDGCERYMFIEKLMDLIYREVIPSDYFTDVMDALAATSLFPLNWSSNIPDGSIFMAIFDQARKPKDISSSTLAEDAGTSSSTPTTVSSIIVHPYEDFSSLPRYCFNVYRHFSERKYQRYPERQHKDISKVGIEKHIRRMFPWIYTAILEALLSGSPDFHAEWPRNARDEAFTTLLSYSPFAKDAQMVLEDVDGFIFPRRR